jgi:sulfur-carrier protein
MPKVSFTPHLRRHVECPNGPADGATVREVLESYFSQHPLVRNYVLDEQGELRRHVVLFVNGEQVTDRAKQAEPIGANDELYVMQALSGG